MCNQVRGSHFDGLLDRNPPDVGEARVDVDYQGTDF
jgi:hypothetical protein